MPEEYTNKLHLGLALHPAPRRLQTVCQPWIRDSDGPPGRSRHPTADPHALAAKADDFKLEVIGKPIIIGDEIPVARWVTVELRMNREEASRYDAIHQRCVPRIHQGVDKQGNPFRNARTHRRLQLATLTPDLDRFETRTTARARRAEKSRGTGKRSGKAAVHEFRQDGDGGAWQSERELTPRFQVAFSISITPLNHSSQR
ncbi:MAG: hypothetical protein Q9178_004632 [Gyalolechia marmorata]